MKDSDLKKVVMEAVLSSLNEEDHEFEFKRGVRWAVKHRQTGKSFDEDELSTFSPSFIKGYNSLMKGSAWDRFNSKLTDYLARLGYSRTRN